MNSAGYKILTAILLWALCLGNDRVCAQNKISTLDRDRIVAAAKATLNDYMVMLDKLGSNDYGSEDKNDFIVSLTDGAKALFKNKAQIEGDLDPNVHSSPSATSYNVAEYLQEVVLQYRQTRPGVYAEFDIPCVKYTPALGTYIEIPFRHTMGGTNALSGKPYKQNFRFATMLAVSSGKGEWKAIIASITFYDPSLVSNKNCVEINDAKTPDEAVEPDTKDDVYAGYMIQRGDRMKAENKYELAYYAYKEAGKNVQFSKDASQKIDALFEKMRQTIQGVNEYLVRALSAKGRELEAAGKYEDALVWYAYAKERDPSNSAIISRFRNINDKAALQRQLNGYYERKIYDKGVIEYTKAIADEPENSNLYIGRAKCYARLGKDYEARNDFAKARQLDASNVDIYLWMGRYYEERNVPGNYDSAYTYYTTYFNRSDDKAAPATREIYYRAVYCKGIKLFRQNNFREALDSFNTAFASCPSFAEAQCYIGASQLKLNQPREATSSLMNAMRLNDKLPDAHYWYAKALFAGNNASASEKAINEMKAAIAYNPANGDWSYELGAILMGNADMLGAIEYFNKCLAANPRKYYMAYLSKARCHKGISSFTEARADYQKYKDALEERKQPLPSSVQREIDDLGK